MFWFIRVTAQPEGARELPVAGNAEVGHHLFFAVLAIGDGHRETTRCLLAVVMGLLAATAELMVRGLRNADTVHINLTVEFSTGRGGDRVGDGPSATEFGKLVIRLHLVPERDAPAGE